MSCPRFGAVRRVFFVCVGQEICSLVIALAHVTARSNLGSNLLQDGHGDMYPNPPLFALVWGCLCSLFSLSFSHICVSTPSRFFFSPSLNLLPSLVLLISATESYKSVLGFLIGNPSPLG